MWTENKKKGTIKTRNLFLLPALISVLNSLPAGRVTAQRFTTLYSFTAAPYNGSCCDTNNDGINPQAGLITNSSGNTLYGTALRGGGSGNGTGFAAHAGGAGFTRRPRFTTSTASPP